MLQAGGDFGFVRAEVAGELIDLGLQDGVLLREDGAFVLEVVEIVPAEGGALGGFAQGIAGLLERFLAEGESALRNRCLVLRLDELVA